MNTTASHSNLLPKFESEHTTTRKTMSVDHFCMKNMLKFPTQQLFWWRLELVIFVLQGMCSNQLATVSHMLTYLNNCFYVVINVTLSSYNTWLCHCKFYIFQVGPVVQSPQQICLASLNISQTLKVEADPKNFNDIEVMKITNGSLR